MCVCVWVVGEGGLPLSTLLNIRVRYIYIVDAYTVGSMREEGSFYKSGVMRRKGA